MCNEGAHSMYTAKKSNRERNIEREFYDLWNNVFHSKAKCMIYTTHCFVVVLACLHNSMKFSGRIHCVRHLKPQAFSLGWFCFQLPRSKRLVRTSESRREKKNMYDVRIILCHIILLSLWLLLVVGFLVGFWSKPKLIRCIVYLYTWMLW